MIADLCTRPTDAGLVAGLLADVDCQASGLVERGYLALSAPGTAATALLTTLMTVAVAFYGYRLLLGRGLAIGDVVTLAIKLGVVLTIAASWGSWQTIAYDALARGPTGLASEVVTSIGATPPLDGVQTALDRIEASNVGWRTRAGIASPLVGGAPSAAMALNVSAFLLTISTLGLLVVARIVLALLLAVAPVIAGFLLFDPTRGLVDGWLRAMVAAALVPINVLVLTAIELAVLTPLLDRMIERQGAGTFEIADVTPVALVVIVFTLAIVAGARAMATIARGIRIPSSTRAPAATVPAATIERAERDRQALIQASTARAQPAILRSLESAARRDGNGNATRTAVTMFSEGRASAARAQSGTTVLAAASSSRDAVIGTRSPTASIRPALPRASRAAARRDS
jgi:type IV secretion system protein VirB6